FRSAGSAMTGDADVDPRARALAQIVSLAREHQLTAGDIAAALTDDGTLAPSQVRLKADTTEGRGRGVIVRVLGYLGGTCVFAGIAALIALQWDAMNSAARVVITLGSGLAAFGLATLASRDARF